MAQVNQYIFDPNEKREIFRPVRGYIPTYRPKEKWRQTTCNINFIHSFLNAKDEVRKTNQAVNIIGFGGWKVHPIKGERDIDE